jgi:prepilin-type processing-associated H-X9-DG protein
MVCGQNLVELGKAMHEYAQEHSDCLPPAAISNEQGQASWDLKIKNYLPPKASSTGDYYADLRQRRAVTPIFKCPSDIERRREHEAPRSYAMPLYDPRRGGVQPSPESPTGVGIRFPDANFNECPVEGGRSTERAAEKAASPPVVHLSIITEPVDTLLLTEHVSPANALWNSSHATVADTSDQLQSQMLAESAFHGGRFNYLMIDGHVEALTPIETVGHVGQAGSNPATHYGIWTIRPGD